MIFRILLSVLCSCFISIEIHAENLDIFRCFSDSVPTAQDSLPPALNDSVNERKDFFLAFPAAYYTPETRWGFGLAGIYNFHPNKKDTISPSSDIQLAFSYTQNKQILVYLPVKLYWDEWKKVLETEFGYYDYIYPYFGIGVQTKESDFERYHSKYFRFQLDALQRLGKYSFLGLRYWLDTPDIYKFKEDGLLENSSILGKYGGNISGFGPQFRMDKRDNIYSSKTGFYVNMLFQKFDKSIGSDFNFNRVRIDARKFMRLNKITLAGQLYSDINWGDIPFYQRAKLGGMKRLRGFLEGRYLDNISVIPQLEGRFDIWKNIGGVGFLSGGTVSSKLNEIIQSEWKYSYGAGLRYTLDKEKNIKVRLDYAFTSEGSNFYFTIGEAF